MGKKSIAVEIAGQRYVVKSDADATYVRNLASFVSKRIAEVESGNRSIPTARLAVLAALNIADELFQERSRQKEFRRQVQDRSQAILKYLEKEERRLSPKS